MSVATLHEGGATRSPGSRLLDLRRAWLGMDRSEGAIAFAATPLGVAVLYIGFMAGLAATLELGAPHLVLVAGALFACAMLPRHRLLVLVGSSLVFLFLRPYRTGDFADLVRSLAAAPGAGGPLDPMLLQVASVAVFLAFSWCLLEAQRRFPSAGFARRPVIAMMAGFFALLLAGCLTAPGTWAHTASWAFLAVYASCFWLLAYAMADQKAKDATPNVLRATYMRPFWGGEAVPFGKGHAYLAKFDAKTEEDLAVTRLKAVKLVVWAAILALVYKGLATLIHDYGAVPTLNEAVILQIEGSDASLAARWASVVSNYFLDLLIIAVWGHALVAIVRMAGYRIPRNTVNPLASRSIAEFWNRYYYYFKELVVDFFFYPAFLRWFKKSPKLRIAFATFCAAGLGNFLYHFMRETHVFAGGEIAGMMPRFATLAFYTAALSAGLIISQLRGRKPKPEDGFWRYHVTPRLGVMAFFCFLKIFDDVFGIGTLGDRMVFFTRLFGV